MNILEIAQASFAARPMDFVDVPEWGIEGKPVPRVYYKTPNASLLSRVTREAKGNLFEEWARLVALVATDENGKRLFTDAAYTDLMISVEPRGVAKVAAAILAEARLNVAQAEKNSEATHS